VAAGQHKRKQADNYFKEARADDPNDLLAAHNHAALLADWKGHEAAAEHIWKAILARNTSHTPSLIGYTNLLKHQRRYEESIPLYRTLVLNMKQYLPAQIDLASALAQTGKLAEASALLDSLIEDRPRNSSAWAARAELMEKAGDRQSARAAWDMALQACRRFPGSKRDSAAAARLGPFK
jgi:tetratricopeptide (TPR) repeat protein